jgi:hypothetical protein
MWKRNEERRRTGCERESGNERGIKSKSQGIREKQGWRKGNKRS